MLSQQSEIGNILILQAIRLPFTQYSLGLVPNHTYRRNRKASPSNQAMDFEYRVFCTAQLLYLLVQSKQSKLCIDCYIFDHSDIGKISNNHYLSRKYAQKSIEI